jgi:hypothetical protein
MDDRDKDEIKLELLTAEEEKLIIPKLEEVCRQDLGRWVCLLPMPNLARSKHHPNRLIILKGLLFWFWSLIRKRNSRANNIASRSSKNPTALVAVATRVSFHGETIIYI